MSEEMEVKRKPGRPRTKERVPILTPEQVEGLLTPQQREEREARERERLRGIERRARAKSAMEGTLPPETDVECYVSVEEGAEDLFALVKEHGTVTMELVLLGQYWKTPLYAEKFQGSDPTSIFARTGLVVALRGHKVHQFEQFLSTWKAYLERHPNSRRSVTGKWLHDTSMQMRKPAGSGAAGNRQPIQRTSSRVLLQSMPRLGAQEQSGEHDCGAWRVHAVRRAQVGEARRSLAGFSIFQSTGADNAPKPVCYRTSADPEIHLSGYPTNQELGSRQGVAFVWRDPSFYFSTGM